MEQWSTTMKNKLWKQPNSLQGSKDLTPSMAFVERFHCIANQQLNFYVFFLFLFSIDLSRIPNLEYYLMEYAEINTALHLCHLQLVFGWLEK